MAYEIEICMLSVEWDSAHYYCGGNATASMGGRFSEVDDVVSDQSALLTVHR